MSTGVYFIGIHGRPNIIKIGKSKNCEKRIKQLQTGNPDKLFIHKIIITEHPYHLETALHRYFKKEKYNKGGGNEWYTISSKRIDRIIISNSSNTNFEISERETWSSLVFRGIKMGTFYIYRSIKT